MLVHHADAGGDGRLAVADGDRIAVDADLAAVGLIEAVEDRHQRRLAGAVLADDAVDRALGDGQIDILVGVDRPEALVDAHEFDGRRLAHNAAPETGLPDMKRAYDDSMRHTPSFHISSSGRRCRPCSRAP